MNSLWTIALHEFTVNRRNRWVVSFAVLFALLTFLVSFFGMVTSGYAGFQDFTRTTASLVNLAGFIIPLFALLLGVFSLISNREYLDLLAVQPLSRWKLLLGKYLGLLLTVVGAALVGFGLPGAVIALTIGTGGVLAYAGVVLLSLILGAVFLGVALLATLLAQRRQIALGLAVGVWLFYELFYGLMVMGTTLYFTPKVLKVALLALLAGNPVDLTRVLSLLMVGGPYFFGPAGATLLKLTGSAAAVAGLGAAVLALWSFFPLYAALRLFSRQDL